MVPVVAVGVFVLWLLAGKRRTTPVVGEVYVSPTPSSWGAPIQEPERTVTVKESDPPMSESDSWTWPIPLGDNVLRPRRYGQEYPVARVTATRRDQSEWINDLSRPDRTRLELAVGAGETTAAFILVNDQVAKDCGQDEYDAWIKRIDAKTTATGPVGVVTDADLKKFDDLLGRLSISSDITTAGNYVIVAGNSYWWRTQPSGTKVWIKSQKPYPGFQDAEPNEPGAALATVTMYNGAAYLERVTQKGDAIGIPFLDGTLGVKLPARILAMVTKADVGDYEGAASDFIEGWDALQGDDGDAAKKFKQLTAAVGMTRGKVEIYQACLKEGGDDTSCSLEVSGVANLSYGATLKAALPK